MHPDVNTGAQYSKYLLYFAIAIEISCVTIGLILAVSAGFEAATTPAAMLSAALPFAAAAIVEIGRLPMVSAAFLARGIGWRALASAAVLVISLQTFENLSFSFEKAFILRVRAVTSAVQAADSAAKRVEHLTAANVAAGARVTAEQHELDRIDAEREALDKRFSGDVQIENHDGSDSKAQAQANLDRDNAALTGLLATQADERNRAYAACRAANIFPCNQVPISRQMRDRKKLEDAVQADRAQLATVTGDVQHRQDSLRYERQQELNDIEARKTVAQERLAMARAEADKANDDLVQARDDLLAKQNTAQELRASSQMHRLAADLWGDTSDAATRRALALFSMISAAVLTLAGSALAAMHYRIVTQPPPEATGARMGWGVGATLKAIRDRMNWRPMPEYYVLVIPLEATPAERRAIIEKAKRDGRIPWDWSAPGFEMPEAAD